ncbi:MAG: hypothetical protein ACI4J0_10590 [Huintestinicola sp.]|uniref:hypothetical protein n=1 Tax=Huintestinicola sp. TaxID=2981661 RepID=UPI003F110FE8
MKAVKSLKDSIKGFLKMTGHYADSAMYLAEHGYNDEYMKMLSAECETAGNPKEKAEGQALTAQGLLFRGKLRDALKAFEETDISRLPKAVGHVFANNYILCLFLLEKPERIRTLYEEQNKLVLGEGSLVMRRTVGIKEFIEKRYENAVTVFIKLLSEPDPRCTLMADICIVKAMLKLDMKERAAEIAELGFGRYSGMGDITALVNRLRLMINAVPRTNGGKNNKKKKRK